MAFKIVVLLCAVAAANAGLLGAPVATYAAASPYAVHSPLAVHAPAIGASQQSVVRSLDGNHAVSTYAKQVDTAFSSVRKYDTRVSNDAVGIAHAPIATYAAAPAYAHTYAAPALAHTYAAPAYAQTYAAPALAHTYAAPALAHTYAAPALAHAPLAYAAPAGVVKTSTSAVAGHGLLGVAYSAAPVVSHMTYSNGLGLSYGW